MKIAVIGSKGLPPKQGGIEHYCAEIYPRMVEKGHSVDLFAQSSYTDLPWFYEHDFQGVRVITTPAPQYKGMSAFAASGFGALLTRISEYSYDIVHFHALGPSLFTWLPRLTTSSKVVVTCQGLDWQRAKWGKLSSQLIRLGEKTAVRNAHEIIVVSKHLGEYFKNQYQRQTTYIPNAPAGYKDSDPKFSYVNSLGLTPQKYILFLGRLVPEKRPDLLIETFKSLNLPDWKLILVGEVSNTTDYKNKLKALAFENSNILFSGELHGSRLAEVVRGAGLFALPSDLEGLPLAMLEAMSEGIPVIASDIPPHQQLIDNECGIPFKAGDSDSFRSSLDWAIKNPTFLRKMAKNAQQNIKINYNWEKVTQENLEVYTRLITNTDLQEIKIKVTTGI